MLSVAIVLHHERPEAARLAVEAIEWLEARGHRGVIPSLDAKATGLEQHACDEAVLTDGLDLAVCLGGDGTMLRTISMVGSAGVPVLGVNVGHLGYLTEVAPVGLYDALEAFIDGDCQIEERLVIEVGVQRAGEAVIQPLRTALNEIVVRSDGTHLVRLDLSIGGERFTSYAADALLVATPTGSTAYNLSARGPIVAPGLRALIVTPVAAHQLFDRTLVLEPDVEVRIELLDWRPGRLQCDGFDTASLATGDVVVCRSGTWSARVVTLGPRDFRGILRAKFGLEDR